MQRLRSASDVPGSLLLRLVDFTAEHQEEFGISPRAAVRIELLHAMVGHVGDKDVAMAVDCDAEPFLQLAIATTFRPFQASSRPGARLQFRSPRAHTPAPGFHELAPRRKLIDPLVEAIGDVEVAGRFVRRHAERGNTLTR